MPSYMAALCANLCHQSVIVAVVVVVVLVLVIDSFMCKPFLFGITILLLTLIMPAPT